MNRFGFGEMEHSTFAEKASHRSVKRYSEKRDARPATGSLGVEIGHWDSQTEKLKIESDFNAVLKLKTREGSSERSRTLLTR